MPATRSSNLRASIRRGAVNSRLFAWWRIPTIVIVDESPHTLRLRDVPLVGSLLDVGYPVSVTSSKSVAGGRALVYAKRVQPTAPTA